MHRSINTARVGMTLVELLVATAVVSCMVGLLLPAIGSVREASRQATCGNNLRQICIAVLEHESSHRRLPANEDLSWTQRVSIHTDGKTVDAVPLAKALEAERERLLRLLPTVFTCPSAVTKTVSTYPGAHVGHNPLLLGGRMSQITDGVSKTLLVGELQPSFGAPWVLGPTVSEQHFGSDHRTAINVGLVDGSVRRVPTEKTTAAIVTLLTPSGNEPPDSLRFLP